MISFREGEFVGGIIGGDGAGEGGLFLVVGLFVFFVLFSSAVRAG